MADQNSERWKAFMDQDFDPGHTPGATPATEQRIANALEYIAYQLGQINRKLDLVIGARDSEA
jgi:hypothetical protein